MSGENPKPLAPFEARLAQIRGMEDHIRAHVRQQAQNIEHDAKNAYSIVMATPPAYLWAALRNHQDPQNALEKAADVIAFEVEQAFLMAMVRKIGVKSVQTSFYRESVTLPLDAYTIPTDASLRASFSKKPELLEEATARGKEEGILRLLTLLLPPNMSLQRTPVPGMENSVDTKTVIEGIEVRYTRDPETSELTREVIVSPIKR